MAISALTEMGTGWIRPNLLLADYSGIGGFFDRRHRRKLLNEPYERGCAVGCCRQPRILPRRIGGPLPTYEDKCTRKIAQTTDRENSQNLDMGTEPLKTCGMLPTPMESGTSLGIKA